MAEAGFRLVAKHQPGRIYPEYLGYLIDFAWSKALAVFYLLDYRLVCPCLARQLLLGPALLLTPQTHTLPQ